MSSRFKKCKCKCECSSDSDDDDCERYPSKMSLSPEESFKNILNLIDGEISTNINKKTNHLSNMIHFKNMCNSLNPNDDMHNKIKNIMIIQYKTHSSLIDIYDEILYTIGNEQITDFTINFPNDKSIKCLKMVIQKIPYFDMMIKDCDITDTITLNDDYDNVMTIIKLLYNSKSFTMEIKNITDTLLLTDKYLMVDNLERLMNYVEKYSHDILRHLIKTKDTDKILALYKYFSDALTNDNFKKYFNIQIIINNIHKFDLGEYIFLIDNWDTKFDGADILNAIKQTSKYEFLNILKISPLEIIGSLKDIDFSNNIYYKIRKQIYSQGAQLTYNNNMFSMHDANVINITSYYPKFSYTSYNKNCGTYNKISDNCINYRFTSHSPNPLPIGTKILIDTNISNKELYTITKIIKYNNDKKMEVQDADWYGLYSPVKYEIYFDKPIAVPNYSRFWVVESSEHDIKI